MDLSVFVQELPIELFIELEVAVQTRRAALGLLQLESQDVVLDNAEVRALVAGQTIGAIRLLRERTHMGLKNAVDIVRQFKKEHGLT